MKSSPRNGFRGFFSFPNLSLRLAYCCFKVLKNHFNTSNALFWGSFSLAGATNIDGCSPQYELNSTRDVEERINGGAVSDDKSPEKDAMDFRKAVHEPLFWAETPAPSFSLEDIIVGVVVLVGCLMVDGLVLGLVAWLASGRLEGTMTV